MTTIDLHELLKRSFGFDSFRPLQREIMEDSLAGRDVFALLPTGGGKSLCYQLPALIRPGLTVVVSPLIALMKDKVDAIGRRRELSSKRLLGAALVACSLMSLVLLLKGNQ